MFCECFDVEPVFVIIRHFHHFKHKLSGTFGQIHKAHRPISPSHTNTHTDRGGQTACYLLCTAYRGISLMQGDAMKEQSDANTAVFVWGVIMPLCMHMCCHPCHTDLVTEWENLHHRVMWHTHSWQRGLHSSSYMPPNPLVSAYACMRSRARDLSIRCQSGSSPHLFISMTEELSCQSS